MLVLCIFFPLKVVAYVSVIFKRMYIFTYIECIYLRSMTLTLRHEMCGVWIVSLVILLTCRDLLVDGLNMFKSL